MVDNSSTPPMSVSINETLTDDELRWILSKLDKRDGGVFALVCKRWLHLQSTEQKKLALRAGPHMLHRMAARFSQVVELDYSNSSARSFYPGVTDSDLAVVANSFKCLRVLKLQDCRAITDRGMASIGDGLSCLQSLDVTNCRKLTDRGFSAVAKGCHDLRSMHLGGCKLVTDGMLLALSKNCPNLEELGLQGCSNLTDDGLTCLVSGCRRITFLDINKCGKVGNIGISTVSEACSSFLRTLKLLDCYKVGDESILSLARFCINLETLIIGGCRDISDDSIKSLAAACKNSLKILRMDWCVNISNASLSCILTQCNKLEALDIGSCEEVTDAAFQGLDNCETKLSLRLLKVSNCPKITITGISTLLGKCNSLEYLDVRSCPHITKAGFDEAGLQFPNCCKVKFTGSLSEPDVIV
ncbi:F-box/LRR-repeat protein 4 isoform X1 [Tripterygium wilfordii]|uniref:F-box/LRR-repeat protein 4 isoform X1 n=1 Tax=Tripterygium wilfordii TaxID=458696 RepID=A0A7J7DU77_TRIWF|nr:F-box/LRR-repeat protein 2-like [Tripterygium wilfordii]KAF5749853.1 F-box/LRR-repeat protein 4 isoform X1 [Tripterygium wilfordii]